MSIILSASQLQIIYTHAEDTYPEECCGILLGKTAAGSKLVVEVITTMNTWESSAIADVNTDDVNRTKHTRYTIPPWAIFDAQKRGRDLHLEIVGFYHSHPDATAIPSTCDRDRAWEVYSYPIVAVVQGKVSDLTSWVLDGDGRFQPEQIHLTLDK